MNACCNGCGLAGVPSPSRVTTFLPTAEDTGTEHERTALPSTSTVHEPHWPRPQPKSGPCNPRSSRSAYSRGISGSSATTDAGLPFTLSASFIEAPLPCRKCRHFVPARGGCKYPACRGRMNSALPRVIAAGMAFVDANSFARAAPLIERTAEEAQPDRDHGQHEQRDRPGLRDDLVPAVALEQHAANDAQKMGERQRLPDVL